MQFVISELLEAESQWALISDFARLDTALTPQVLAEAERFVSRAVAPLRASGDSEGCRFLEGSVTTPGGFAAAYQEFCAAGWPSLACDVSSGGQGLPQLLNAALYEMLNAANHAWAMYPGLAHGAYECIRAFATEELKRVYLPKIVNGTWLATMCLTEPAAGTDLGELKTQARLLPGGSYAISGTKIFISGGEHDLSENIVHMLLARLPDAPEGSRGISLFLVPKLLPTPGGLRRNRVWCEGIEEKMGIKGSATCTMRFQDAEGWLLGDANRGLNAMFVMMNAARLHVGLQGLGHCESAYQNASRYAAERVQMRPVMSRGRSVAEPGRLSPIADHAPVRRSLLTMRALAEGGRALAYWCAHTLDLAEHLTDPVSRSQATDLAAILTPIVKSMLTENGFVSASRALQIWGGYGYIRGYGIEQCVRDARVAMIYEGTNEVQAIDLLIRKVLGDGRQRFQLLENTLRTQITACDGVTELRPMAAELDDLLRQLSQATAEIAYETPTDPELPHRVACDFLRALGLVTMGALWLRSAGIAVAKRGMGAFYLRKLETAAFYFNYVLPEASFSLDLVRRGRLPLPRSEE